MLDTIKQINESRAGVLHGNDGNHASRKKSCLEKRLWKWLRPTKNA